MIRYYELHHQIYKVEDYKVYMYISRTKKWKLSIYAALGTFREESGQLTLLDLDMLGVLHD